MVDLLEEFTIHFRDRELLVKPQKVKDSYLYVVYLNQQPILALTNAKRDDGSRFWSSIPEGKLKEAEAIGPLITEHYKQAATTV